MDAGQRETDELLADLEKRIRKEYSKAQMEVQGKLDDYMSRYYLKDKKWREWVKSGIKTKDEYKKWQTGQLAVGKRWEAMKTTLAEDLYNTDKIARSITKGYMPEVYAINHNYGTYEVEVGAKLNTSYTLYDRQTVERLMRDDPNLLPAPGKKVSKAIAEGKAIRWNKQQLQSVMMQGILQGESIPKLAKRLAKEVSDSDYKAAIRNARTMTTGAQNAGRVDSYKRAESMGIDMMQEWRAVFDNRTRHEHRMLDGQRQKVGDPFKVDGIEIGYPGDLSAPGYMVYNCRCTLRGIVAGLEPQARKYRSYEAVGDMTYEEWKAQKKSESRPITLQADKGEAIAESYRREYRDGRSYDSQKDVRETVHVQDLPKEVQEALYQYTDGKYDHYCEYSQYIVNGDADISPSLFSSNKKWWEENRFPDITEDEKKNTKIILDTIINQPISDEPLVRIERGAKNVNHGDTISFGLRSTSADMTFIDKIADEKMEGFDFDLYGKNNNGDWTEYHFINSKNLDVSSISAYKDQDERIIAGKYKVVNVDVIEVVKAHDIEYETPMKELATNVEEFVSKKSGKKRIRYTYNGEDHVDTPEEFEKRTVKGRKYVSPVWGRTIITLEVDE